MTTEGQLSVGGEVVDNTQCSSGIDHFVMSILFLFLAIVITTEGIERRRVSVERSARVQISFQSEDIFSTECRWG
jgi:hypothetical protein